jgi:hypothetical protein
MGTHWGLVFILDFNGNEIKRWTAHSATVNEICIEETGECICLSSLSLSSSPFFLASRPVVTYARCWILQR